MTVRFTVALGALAALSLATYFMLHAETTASHASGAVINISGQQRMLAQRLALHALALTHSEHPAERSKSRQEMLNTMHTMETAVAGLLHGDALAKLPGNPSPQMRAIYFAPPLHLHERLRRYLDASKALCRAPESELRSGNPQLQYILAAAASELPQALDSAVRQYQRESEEAIARLERMEQFVLVLTLGLIAIIGGFIFRPMVSQIRADLAERQRAAMEREQLIGELQEALAGVKSLRGLLPICAYCKKIRDDRGYWKQVEDYIAEHAQVDFTHGFCPECARKWEEET